MMIGLPLLYQHISALTYSTVLYWSNKFPEGTRDILPSPSPCPLPLSSPLSYPHPPGIPAVPWPTAAMQTQFKPVSTHPVATATTGMLLPSAPSPHAYLFPQQPIYGAPLVWGSFGLPTSTTTAAPASLHQQLQSGLIPPVPGVVRASPAPRTLQRGGADNASALVHKDENTGQISQKASSSLKQH